MKRSLALVVALTVGALTAGACGVPTRGSADRANPDDVPFGLLDQVPSSSSSLSRSGTPVEVYFYDAGTERLVQVVTETDDPSLDGVLRLLQEVPGGAGLPVGNPLGDVEVIRSVAVSRGRATVDLTEAFGGIAGTAQLVALAEMVYTATGRPGVGQVVFTLGGQPIEVPRGDGSLTSDPLTRSDYPKLAPLG